MKKILSLFTILLSTYIFAQWNIVVIDTGTHSPSSNVPFQPGLVSLAVDRTNKVHITYKGVYIFDSNSNSISDSVLQYVKYDSSTSKKEIDSVIQGEINSLGPYCGISPSITIDSNNKIYICHLYETGSDNPIEILYSLDGSTFSYINGLDDDHRRTIAKFRVDKNNIFHIIYYDSTDYSLKYYQYTNNSLSKKAEIKFENGFLLNRLSIDVDSQSRLHLTYSVGPGTYTAYYGFYDGTKISTETVDVGEFPTLGVDKDDNIHLCYRSTATFTFYGYSQDLPAIIYKKKTLQGWTNKQPIAISYPDSVCDRIVFGQNGSLHLVICDGNLKFTPDPYPGLNGLIYLSKLTPSATYWQAEVIENSINLQNPQQQFLYINPVIDIDSNGQIHVCYHRKTTILPQTVYNELVYATKSPVSSDGEGGTGGGGTGGGTVSPQEDIVKPAKIHFTPTSAIKKKIDELKKKLQQ